MRTKITPPGLAVRREHWVQRGREVSTRKRQDKGSLSYARRASGVKKKMARSVCKRRMDNGPSADSSVTTVPTLPALPSRCMLMVAAQSTSARGEGEEG